MDERPEMGRVLVVRDVVSGPAELQGATPLRAVTLGSLARGDGYGVVWCAQLESPIKHRVDQIENADRYEVDYLDHDDRGRFFWAYYIAVQLREGAVFTRGEPADVAVVVDTSLGNESTFDATKVDWVATATVDFLETDQSPGAQPDVQPGQEPPPRQKPAPIQRTPVAAPSPVERLAQDGREVSGERFALALDEAIATVAGLTGVPRGHLPRPQEVKAHKHSRSRDREAGPLYSFKGTDLRYSTMDPVRGPVWESTTNPEEALYWMVDDVARSAAMAWARRTPSAQVMGRSQIQWLLAAPMWQTLMTAINAQWAERTRARISALQQHSAEIAATPDASETPPTRR